jgi:hypothetical protein
MQQKEYPQLHEFGLGSLVGDFFQNVKDTVTGVAKAVAPIAPFVIPFAAPALAGTGIGSLLGGGVGRFLTSKVGQAALGAGISALAGQKPADIAKNLALQVATSGVRGVLSGKEGTFGQRFMSGVTGREVPQVTSVPTQGGSFTVGDVLAEPTARTPDFSEASMNFATNLDVPTGAEESSSFLSRLGKTLDPGQRTINPKYAQLEALGVAPEKIIASGISKEAPFTYQYGPALYAGLTALPLAEQYLGPQQEEEEEEYVREDLYTPNYAQYQLLDITGPSGYDPTVYAAEGGEMVTGFAQGGGQKITHPDGKTREHPKRIGEIVGPGTGTSDDIPAMLSDGEFVMTAKAVRNAGGGSRKEGAKNMYKMMKSLENGGSLSRQSIGMA